MVPGQATRYLDRPAVYETAGRDDLETPWRAVKCGELVGERYVLEVSSPGADRPLRSAADWRRFVGRRATVTTAALAGGKQEVEILALDGEEGGEVAVLRDPKGREVRVPLAEISAARLAFHWKR
jgi:ribosome maturation factor RimP